MSLCTVYVLLLLGVQLVGSVMYSHTITEDTTWYYRQLTTEPSLIMEIEFSIVCLEGPPALRFNLYTTEDNINLQKNCSFRISGQLDNGHFWTPLRPGNYIKYLCLEEKNGFLYCTGKTVVQDFKPRNISMSIGNGCDYPGKKSLKGLSFNISVSGQRNKTDCVPLRNTPQLNCVKFYPFASFPNLVGYKLDEAISTAESISLAFNEGPGGCYKFLFEMLCHIFVPKCDITRRVTIPPCRENCWDLVNACLGIVKKIYHKSDLKTFLNCDYLPTVGSDIKCFYKAVTCEAPAKIPHGRIEDGVISNGTYPLHAQLNIKCVNETFVMKGNHTITCQYTGTWSHPPQCVLRACPEPPIVEHAHIEQHQNVSEVYPWHTEVTYVCDNKTFHMEGNSTITCLKNEHWSPAPECVEFVPDIINENKLKTLEIVLPTVFVVLLTFTSICLVLMYKKKLKLKRISLPDIYTLDNVELRRMKKYDAFICYRFDSDDLFVKNTIIPKLEQKHDPPFQLCIHDREFAPGTLVLDNMQVGIENSNSAILVMSQGFVDSVWCQQEFQYCHIEHMNDPAFKLFIIVMQPVHSLQNLTECMKQYFVQETYLKKDDEKLFTKIASYLTLVKQPKDDGGTQGGIEVNPDEDQEDQGHQQNEGGFTVGDTQNETDVNDDHRNDDAVDGHENITNEAEDENDVRVIVHNVDDVSDDDENVPLLFN